jgi:hypothetical protein
MRQEKGTKLKSYAGVYRLSDGTFRIVAKAIDPKTGKPKFKERFTREVDPRMPQNAAIAYRTQLINEIKTGTTGSGVPTEIPRLETLCRSSWITFVTENVASESRAAKLGRMVETHILRRWGEHFIDKITVPEIDAWVRSLTADYVPETIRHHVGLFRRIVSKARGQYQWSVPVASHRLGSDHAAHCGQRARDEQPAHCRAGRGGPADRRRAVPVLRADDLRAVHAGLALLPRRCDAVEQARCGRRDRDRGVV